MRESSGRSSFIIKKFLSKHCEISILLDISRFRIWWCGEWTEVLIDDRLPVVNGKLVFIHSQTSSPFWPALLEKAYAKLHGSYKNLEGGLTIEAAVDFTGGIPEMISLARLKITPERLFYIMSKADEGGAFMGAALAVRIYSMHEN